MKFNTAIYLFFSLSIIGSLSAQEKVVENTDDYVTSFQSIKPKDRIHYGFSTGVGMTYSKSYGSSFSTFYSPKVNYEVSPKLDVSAGATIINTSFQNFKILNDFGYQPFNGNFSQYYTYVSARYQLTDKLKVGGRISYNMSNYSQFENFSNSTKSAFDRLGYSAFFEYKISENTFLQGEIRFNDNSRNGLGMGSYMGGNFGSHDLFFSPHVGW